MLTVHERPPGSQRNRLDGFPLCRTATIFTTAEAYVVAIQEEEKD